MDQRPGILKTSVTDTLTSAVTIALAFAAMAVASQLHAGMPCWIQGLNYLVASVPFGLASAHAIRYRRRRLTRSRRFAVYYFILFIAITAYAWRSVELHRGLVDQEERSLAPAIAALADYHSRYGRYPETLEEIGARPQEPLRFRLWYATQDAGARYTLTFVHNLLRKHSYKPDGGAWLDWD